MNYYIKEIKEELTNFEGTIVAATKYFTDQEMREVYQLGLHDFGENRVQNFLEKYEALSDLPITWHFIGTLQRKKVKKCIDKIDYLHSLDHLSLAEEIDKRRTSPLKCFLQVNISDEESKHGLSPKEVIPFIKKISHLTNIDLIGFMGMAKHTKDEQIIAREFQKLNDLQVIVKEQLGLDLKELSIGMSNDYKLAIKHNATFLRLGSVLFKKEVAQWFLEEKISKRLTKLSLF